MGRLYAIEGSKACTGATDFVISGLPEGVYLFGYLRADRVTGSASSSYSVILFSGTAGNTEDKLDSASGISATDGHAKKMPVQNSLYGNMPRQHMVWVRDGDPVTVRVTPDVGGDTYKVQALLELLDDNPVVKVAT